MNKFIFSMGSGTLRAEATFRCVSWRAKSSLCQQPFQIRPEIWMNK